MATEEEGCAVDAGLEKAAHGWVHVHTTECPPSCDKVPPELWGKWLTFVFNQFKDIRTKALKTNNCTSQQDFEMLVEEAFGVTDTDANGVIEDSVPLTLHA